MTDPYALLAEAKALFRTRVPGALREEMERLFRVESIAPALCAALRQALDDQAQGTHQPNAEIWPALRMIREAVGELFGPAASLESEEAVLLRGPEPHHEAEAIVAALRRAARRSA